MMITYTIPLNETEINDINEFEAKEKLLEGNFPLLFRLTNDLVDNIYITDIESNNLCIGQVEIDYENKMYLITVEGNLPLGNMAIELLDLMTEKDLLQKQTWMQFIIGDDDIPSLAYITLKVSILGELQEDFYSAYFLGHTIRPYAYDKEDYYKRNFTEDELSGENTTNSNPEQDRIEHSSIIKHLFRKLFRRK